LVAGWVLEGRAASAALDRLRLLAISGDVVHLGEDRGGIAGIAVEQGFGEDQIVRRAAKAIGIMQLSHGKHMDLAGAVDSARLDDHFAGLASMGAAVHAERTADATWDAAIEGETGNAGVGS